MAPPLREPRDRSSEGFRAHLAARVGRMLEEARGAFDEALARSIPPGDEHAGERRRRNYLLQQKAGEIRMAEAILSLLKEPTDL